MFNKKENDTSRDNPSLGEEILDFLKIFVISAVVILLFVNFVAHPVQVVGKSMVPTLIDGDYGFTNVMPFSTGDPQRGDVVVVTMENEGQTDHWVKRVIGLPGETVEAREGVIYINGNPLAEPWLDEEYMEETLRELNEDSGLSYDYFTQDFGPVELGEDEYFVLGDNRPYSKDSRDPSVGPVSSGQIFGRSIFVLWPFDNLGGH